VLCRDPLVVYPGTIQGRNIRETGKKGVFYVTLSAGEPGCAEFVPCDVVRWRSEVLSIDGMERDEEFFQAVSDLKETVRRENGRLPALLRLSISGRGKIHGLLRRPGFLRGPGGLLETVNEGEEGRPDFIFTEEIFEVTAPPLDLDSLAAGSHFAGDFLKEVRAFRQGGNLRDGLKNILRERGILDRIPSREVLDVIDSLSDEDAELLLDRGTFSALSGLLEGIDGL